jgi:hypothetical protein
VVIRFSLPDRFDFNEFVSGKTSTFPTSMHPEYVNVAALDAVSVPTVASCYLTPTGEMLYFYYSLRASKIPARPAKHTRQTYIHEAFPVLLYQTRYGVICFAPFQQPANSPVSAIGRRHLTNGTKMRKSAQKRHVVLHGLTTDLTSRRREVGGRPMRQDRHKFRQPLR